MSKRRKRKTQRKNTTALSKKLQNAQNNQKKASTSSPPQTPQPPLQPAEPGPPAPLFYTKMLIGLCAIIALCAVALAIVNLGLIKKGQISTDQLLKQSSEQQKQVTELRKSFSRVTMVMQKTIGELENQAQTQSSKKKVYPAGGSDRAGLNFSNGPRNSNLVALTFDGGAHANAAEDILDTLKSRGVLATMFVTGRFMRAFPQLIIRMNEQGHEIGNHTYSHPSLTTWPQNSRHQTRNDVDSLMLVEELQKTNDVFKKITGEDLDPFWRAPYGEQNFQINAWAKSAGYTHIGWRQGRGWAWTLDSNDWVPDSTHPGYHSPQQVYTKIMQMALGNNGGLGGGIILMHLGTVREDPATQVHRILGVLIDDIRNMGFEFVTISQMVDAANPTDE